MSNPKPSSDEQSPEQLVKDAETAASIALAATRKLGLPQEYIYSSTATAIGTVAARARQFQSHE